LCLLTHLFEIIYDTVVHRVSSKATVLIIRLAMMFVMTELLSASVLASLVPIAYY